MRFGLRDYDPETGRFTSRDPLDLRRQPAQPLRLRRQRARPRAATRAAALGRRLGVRRHRRRRLAQRRRRRRRLLPRGRRRRRRGRRGRRCSARPRTASRVRRGVGVGRRPRGHGLRRARPVQDRQADKVAVKGTFGPAQVGFDSYGGVSARRRPRASTSSWAERQASSNAGAGRGGEARGDRGAARCSCSRRPRRRRRRAVHEDVPGASDGAGATAANWTPGRRARADRRGLHRRRHDRDRGQHGGHRARDPQRAAAAQLGRADANDATEPSTFTDADDRTRRSPRPATSRSATLPWHGGSWTAPGRPPSPPPRARSATPDVHPRRPQARHRGHRHLDGQHRRHGRRDVDQQRGDGHRRRPQRHRRRDGIAPCSATRRDRHRPTGDYSIERGRGRQRRADRRPRPAERLSITTATGVSTGRFEGVYLSERNARSAPGAAINGVVVSGTLILPDDVPIEIGDLTVASGDVTGRTTLTCAAALGLLRQRRRRRHDLILPAGATMTGPPRSACTPSASSPGRRHGHRDRPRPPGDHLGPRTVWENTARSTLVGGLFPRPPATRGRGSINHGTIVKTGTGTITIRPVIVNDGVIDIQARAHHRHALRADPEGDAAVRHRRHRDQRLRGLTATASPLRGPARGDADAGFVPPPATASTVTGSTTRHRSGLFHSTGSSGLRLDETRASNDRARGARRAGLARATRRGAAPARGATTAAARRRRPAASAATRPLSGSPPGGTRRAAPPATRRPRGTRRAALRCARAPAARVVAARADLRVRRLHARPPLRGRQTLRFRFVAPDGRRSRVATLTVRS